MRQLRVVAAGRAEEVVRAGVVAEVRLGGGSQKKRDGAEVGLFATGADVEKQ
ncbi:hypothetical protein V2I01_26420 [Micromonospora sp. BRA006-A]|nr:hypothetical protein [Micromonospora sp. BRA006-A]